MNTDLNAMTNVGLVAMYNALSDKTMKAWKGKKTVLIQKIQALQAKAQTHKEEKQKIAKDHKGETIGDTANSLLQKILYYINDKKEKVTKETAGAMPVGMSYADVLDAVKQKFPKCETNYNCLRCYAGRMREAGEFVPAHREPSKWKTPTKKGGKK